MVVDMPEELYDATLAAGIPRTRIMIAALEAALKEAEQKGDSARLATDLSYPTA